VHANGPMKRNMLTRREGPLLLCRQKDGEPSEQDWNEFLRLLSSQRREFEAKSLKILVHTDGSTPNAEQRKRLAETLGDYHPRVACISDSVKVRFASVLITLFQRNYRQFSVIEIKHAFAHLELSPEQCAFAERTLREFEAALEK
jgi:hypothetical protein